MFNFSKTSPNISTEDPRHPPTTGPASSLAPNSQSFAGTMVKVEYSFIDLEHRLGLAQASLYIHIYTHTLIKDEKQERNFSKTIIFAAT